MTFKERVVSVAISQAPLFKRAYIDYEYLICSDAFKVRDYYILSAHADNYQHLVGVNTPGLSPEAFFQKCISGTLTEGDINFNKPGRLEKEVKGNVRKKINCLPLYTSMMGTELMVQERFTKNSIVCSVAASEHMITIGYINNMMAVPKSLMKGDRLDAAQCGRADLILRRQTGAGLFSTVIFGDNAAIQKYSDKIEGLLDQALLPAGTK